MQIKTNEKNLKKILVIDDSALMRRVMSDIINATNEYKVCYTASDGVKGLSIIEKNINDITAVMCDINMPNMNGLELLRIVNEKKFGIPFIIFSSNTDAQDTITALELGAIEFLKKPEKIFKKNPDFTGRVIKALDMASEIREKKERADKTENVEAKTENIEVKIKQPKIVVEKCKTQIQKETDSRVVLGKKLVALCCSTGGPRALQHVLPKLSAHINAPMVIVQHMPEGFTASLAARLNDLSEVTVKEAEDNEELKKGVCYIAKGGTHLTVVTDMGRDRIKFDDTPPIVGLKPCGNIMYKSICTTDYDEIICVILTGMGADGTKGIQELAKTKKVYIIAQDEDSSTVYGMPKAIYETGLVDCVCDLDDIAKMINKKTEV